MPYADITQPPAPLPAAKLQVLKSGLSLQPPLTRRGTGPGLIVLATADVYDEQVTERDGAPTAVLKWAEEGYTVAQASQSAVDSLGIEVVLTAALKALDECESCQPKGKVGLVCYSTGLWAAASSALVQFSNIVASVVYVDEQNDVIGTTDVPVPLLQHIGGLVKESLVIPSRKGRTKTYQYPTVKGQWFSVGHEDFDYSSDSVAHTRNLQFMKPKMDGPYFDIEDIWDEHTYYEFADRSVEHTMSTMVQEPYVNHVPTLTGGVGRTKLTDFYRNNFIFNNSADTALELVSRTVGVDRVIDEFVFKFTHDREIDWLLPGVPPTHRKGAVPFVAIVNFRGDRLYHEHISWDQGTVLRQLGLMPEYLPFPYPLPDGASLPDGAQVEYRVPVMGVETAEKLRNRKAVPSNEMFSFKIREKKD